MIETKFHDITVKDVYAIVEQVDENDDFKYCDSQAITEEHFNKLVDSKLLGEPKIHVSVVFDKIESKVVCIERIHRLVCNLIKY